MGRTGLKVSEICIGGGSYGLKLEGKDAVNMTAKALAAGINFYDTADAYHKGRSEEVLGKSLKGNRSSVVLATKLGSRTGPGVNDAGSSRKHIMEAIEGSLNRLQTDYIDLYYLHYPDNDTPVEETLRALDDLVHQGKVRYIACSNFSAGQLGKALWASDINKLARFDCAQSPYNLLNRHIEVDILPLCASEGVGVCVYTPLAAGLLTGKYNWEKSPADGTRFGTKREGPIPGHEYWSEANFEIIDNLKRISKEYDRSLTQLSLAWVLNNKTITSAICGVSSLKQLEENVGATELKLSEDEIAAWKNTKDK
ncbi:aldo/keto reductase [Chloroflexota bacterium]